MCSYSQAIENSGRVPLFLWLPVPARRQKIESREKLKMSPKFQKFHGKFKTTREDRKLWPKIQIVSRTLGVLPEIRNCNGRIEKSRGKFKSPAGARTSPSKI
jgi:hypothetical protein